MTADPQETPETGARFAVYLCPPAGSAYYALGSRLLGHDVRAGAPLPLPDFVGPGEQAAARPYGFHLTLVEGFYTEEAQYPAIREEFRAALACFSPAADLRLTNGRVEGWDGGRVMVQRFDPSAHLLALHSLLAGRLARFVTDSPFARELAADPRKFPEGYERARLRLLHTPRALDGFEPHYTLVNPYTGPDPEGLRARLEALTAPFREQRVTSAALFLKPAGQTWWTIGEEQEVGSRE